MLKAYLSSHNNVVSTEDWYHIWLERLPFQETTAEYEPPLPSTPDCTNSYPFAYRGVGYSSNPQMSLEHTTNSPKTLNLLYLLKSPRNMFCTSSML